MVLKNKKDVWNYDREFDESDLNQNNIDKYLNVMANCNQIQNLQFTVVETRVNPGHNKVVLPISIVCQPILPFCPLCLFWLLFSVYVATCRKGNKHRRQRQAKSMSKPI